MISISDGKNTDKRIQNIQKRKYKCMQIHIGDTLIVGRVRVAPFVKSAANLVEIIPSQMEV